MVREAELKIGVDATPAVAAVARPGDTVLIGFDRTLSDDELTELREQFEAFLDTTKIHLAFVENVTSMVVVKGPEQGGE